MCDRGLEVTAVEPSADMRDQLRRAVPGAAVLAGTAEQIPLAGRSVDAVLVAQAWHWVDLRQAVPEVARVLRPGGRLGLLWNIRDEREDWVARLGTIMRSAEGHHASSDTMSGAPQVGPPFGPVERFDVEWVHHLAPDALLDSIGFLVTRVHARMHAELMASLRDLDLEPRHIGSLGALSATGPVAQAVADDLREVPHELVVALELVALDADDGAVVPDAEPAPELAHAPPAASISCSIDASRKST